MVTEQRLDDECQEREDGSVEREHESLLALAELWLKKSEDLKAIKRHGSGLFEPEVIMAEAQVYRQCARDLKKLIGEP